MIWELRHEHKIGLLIEIADIPRSTYYYYSKQFDHPKPDRYAEKKSQSQADFSPKGTERQCTQIRLTSGLRECARKMV